MDEGVDGVTLALGSWFCGDVWQAREGLLYCFV